MYGSSYTGISEDISCNRDADKNCTSLCTVLNLKELIPLPHKEVDKRSWDTK
jgi:hypothetical protein